jgi:hypothetical protein
MLTDCLIIGYNDGLPDDQPEPETLQTMGASECRSPVALVASHLPPFCSFLGSTDKFRDSVHF